MQIKTTMRYHFTPVRMAAIQKSINAGEGVEKREPSYTVGGNAPSPPFIVCRLLDSSHSDQREMVPHCGFDLHFSDNE